MEKLSLKNELTSNAYPGRGIVVGKTADGKHAAIAYFIMGNRSVMKFLVDKTVKMVELPDPWVNLANFNTKDKFELALQKLEN